MREKPERKWIDEKVFLGPVEIENFEPSELSLRILQTVAETLQTHPFLVGGALMAEYNGTTTPKDYDVHFDIEDTAIAKADTKNKKTIEELIEETKQKLRQIPGVEELEKQTHNSRPYSGGIGNIALKLKDADTIIDIQLMNRDLTLDSVAMYGDAVITSCAMDQHGNARFHPRFEDDMENGVWSIRVSRDNDKKASLRRFKEKSRRPGSGIEGFTIEFPDQYARTLGL